MKQLFSTSTRSSPVASATDARNAPNSFQEIARWRVEVHDFFRGIQDDLRNVCDDDESPTTEKKADHNSRP